MIRSLSALLVVLALGVAACSSGTSDTSSPSEESDPTTSSTPTTTTRASSPSTTTNGGSPQALWTRDACTLLTDEEVAAAAGGALPSEEQSGGGSVAAEDYDGASCRWKLSVSQFLTLDVYPATADSLDELAAYNPWDRWAVEAYADVGDDARLVVATGSFELETAGTIQAIVVEDGGLGIRIAFSDKYPASPDALVTAVEQILAQQ
jgi:hypothetical protein